MSHACYAFIVSIFGFACAIRIGEHFIAIKFFDRDAMTKIGTTFFVCVFALSMLFAHSRTSLWFAFLISLSIFCLALSASVSRRANRFRRDVLSILSLVLLKMKSGRSFRQSLSETANESDPHLRSKLTEITSFVAFSQQENRLIRDPFVRDLVSEFVLIDQQPHAATRRLTVLRDKLRTEESFRRRSGQVLSRMRAQSFVMSGLYLAVLAFMIWKFGWRPNSRALTASLLCFSCGFVWMWVGGRRMKWKV